MKVVPAKYKDHIIYERDTPRDMILIGDQIGNEPSLFMYDDQLDVEINNEIILNTWGTITIIPFSKFKKLIKSDEFIKGFNMLESFDVVRSLGESYYCLGSNGMIILPQFQGQITMSGKICDYVDSTLSESEESSEESSEDIHCNLTISSKMQTFPLSLDRKIRDQYYKLTRN